MPPLGQHFLENKRAAVKLAESLAITSGDTVIEIGPGKGALTERLLANCRKNGATLIAIEKDPELIESLQQLRPGEDFRIVQGDVRDTLSEIATKEKNIKIAGNIPYYLSGQLLREIGELNPIPEKTALMLQEEVADRVASQAGDMNLLASIVQLWAVPSVKMRLSPKDFSPPPKVKSAILLLERKKETLEGAERDQYIAFIKNIFRQPRKTAWNNLRSAYGESEKLAKILEQEGISQKARPQDLSLELLIKLSQIIQ